MARNNKKNYKNRNKNNKNRNKNRNKNKGGNVFIPKFYWKNNQGVAGRYAGILEINEKGWGFIRKLDYEFSYNPKDPFLKPEEIKHLDLRQGLILEGEFEEDNQGNKHVFSVDYVNRQPVEA